MSDFRGITKQLPHCHFDPALDSSASSLAFAKAYLQFYQIDFEQQLPGVSHYMGKLSSAGYDIACHYLIPQKPRATVFVVHGYYDHVGLFGHLIRFLLKRNYAVAAFDLPGHGLSSGEPAAIDSFSTYSKVLENVVQAAHTLPKPFYAVGQSTGCAVILGLQAETTCFEKRVLLAPLIRPWHWHKGVWKYRLLKYFVHSIKRRLIDNSADKAFLEFVHHRDPLQAQRLTVSWVGAMKAWIDGFETLKICPAHTLIIQGKKDQTVDWRNNIPMLQKKILDAHIQFFDEADHHLVNESEPLREMVFEKVVGFFG